MAEYIAVDRDTRDKLINALLAYKGTPRHRLFEYPYRDDESRAMIDQADKTVTWLLTVLNERPDAPRLAA